MILFAYFFFAYLDNLWNILYFIATHDELDTGDVATEFRRNREKEEIGRMRWSLVIHTAMSTLLIYLCHIVGNNSRLDKVDSHQQPHRMTFHNEKAK